MEIAGFYNYLALVIGISIIISGCLVAFLFQKYYFSKKGNQVKNSIQVNRYIKRRKSS